MQRPASPPFGLPSHVASNAACACGAQTILSLTVQAITVLARSTPPKKQGRGAPLRFAPMKNGVTAPRFALPYSCRDEERPARFALASGAGRTRNNGDQAKGKQRCLPEQRPPAVRQT